MPATPAVNYISSNAGESGTLPTVTHFQIYFYVDRYSLLISDLNQDGIFTTGNSINNNANLPLVFLMLLLWNVNWQLLPWYDL